MRHLFLFAFCWFSFFARAQADLDLDQLAQHLRTDGLVGEVHGAVDERDLFVFTYRDPKDFFSHIELPLTTDLAPLRTSLKNLKRHQMVRVFGDFIANKAPRRHVILSQLVLEQDYSSIVDNYAYTPKADIKEVVAKDEIVGRVHALDPSGEVLVVEYKDLVIPVFIKAASDIEFVKKLYRGDKIRLRYKVQTYPQSPVHLTPKSAAELGTLAPLEKLAAMTELHGKKLTEEGYLVLFPKSPQIVADTYAVLLEDPEGSSVQMTLANLTDPKIFEQLRLKFQAAWNKDISRVENGRNKLINRGVKVKAFGTGNVVDPGQANPQLLIDRLDQVSFEFVH